MKHRMLIAGLSPVLTRQIKYEALHRGLEVDIVTSTDQMLAAVANGHSPDAILLGNMPGTMNNIALYEQIKAQPHNTPLPIILITDTSTHTATTIREVLRDGDYCLPANAFVLYALVDLLRSMQLF